MLSLLSLPLFQQDHLVPAEALTPIAAALFPRPQRRLSWYATAHNMGGWAMRRRLWRWVGIGAGFVGALVVPRWLPRPRVHGTIPPEQLALPESRWVDVGSGLRLHTVVLGQGDPTLVWFHGFGASVRLDLPFLTRLARRHRVIAFDRPGFGLTPRPTVPWHGQDPYAPVVQPAIAAAVLERFEVTHAVLIGHSAGGPIALATAQRDPARVRGLVLIAPAFEALAMPGVIGWLLAVPLVDWLGPLLLRLFPRLLERPEALRGLWAKPDAAPPHFLEETRLGFTVADWDVGLWRVTKATLRAPLPVAFSLPPTLPVAVLVGDYDRVVPPHQVAAAVRQLGSHVRLTTLPGCGHIPHLECPDATEDAMNAFLATLTP